MRHASTVIGLDIGRHSVKLVRADRDRRSIRFSRAETLRLPSDSAAHAQLIGRWLEELGLLKYSYVIGLPGQTMMFQSMALADDDPRSLDQVASIDNASFNELASGATAYGFAAIPAEGRERKLLLAMARIASVELALYTPQTIGLEVVDLAPSAVALFAAVTAADPGRGESYLCADIGHLGTEIAVGNGAGLMFAGSFQYGYQFLTDSSRGRPGLSLRLPDATKEPAAPSNTQEPSRTPLEQACDVWVSELGVCLSLFRNSFPHEKEQPRRMVLSGGGSGLTELAAALRVKLKMEVVLAGDLPQVPRLPDAHRYMIAAGLAMTGLQSAITSVSLLPAPMRQEMILKRQKPYWILSVIVAALILGVSLLGGYRDFKRMEKQLGAQRESLRRCQEIAARIDDIKARGEVLARMAAPIEHLLRGGPVIRDVIRVVGESRGADDWVTMISDSASYFSGPSGSGVTRSKEAPYRRATGSAEAVASVADTNSAFGRIIVEVYPQRQNPLRVRNLILLMRATEVVKSADLLADDQVVRDPVRDRIWEGVAPQRYVIDVRTSLR